MPKKQKLSAHSKRNAVQIIRNDGPLEEYTQPQEHHYQQSETSEGLYDRLEPVETPQLCHGDMEAKNRDHRTDYLEACRGACGV